MSSTEKTIQEAEIVIDAEELAAAMDDPRLLEANQQADRLLARLVSEGRHHS